jgi:exportin-1
MRCHPVARLQDMLKSFAGSEYATQFHQTYYTLLMREVFAVMTDTFHTPGFKLHCKILLHLFGLVRTDTVIKAPLWDVTVSGGRRGIYLSWRLIL